MDRVRKQNRLLGLSPASLAVAVVVGFAVMTIGCSSGTGTATDASGAGGRADAGVGGRGAGGTRADGGGGTVIGTDGGSGGAMSDGGGGSGGAPTDAGTGGSGGGMGGAMPDAEAGADADGTGGGGGTGGMAPDAAASTGGSGMGGSGTGGSGTGGSGTGGDGTGGDGTGGTGTGGDGAGGSGTGGVGTDAGADTGGDGANDATRTPDGGGGDTPAAPAQKLIILHTNDIHSYLMGYSPEREYTPLALDNDSTRGGFARLAAAIATVRAQAAAAGTPVLLLDGGDFTKGSLFELLDTTEVPELVLMDAMGYDATTLGDGELNWAPGGLAATLAAAAARNVHLPILSSNMNFSASDTRDDQLKALADAGALKTKLLKTVGGIKVGLFGLLGADAIDATPQIAPLTFDRIDTAAIRMVTELRQTDKVDLVIALSHTGIDHNGAGEDAALAQLVPGIDVIVSGHSHELLAQPAMVGPTAIVTAGAFGGYLGKLELTVTPSSTPGGSPAVTVDQYTLISIEDRFLGDAAIQAQVDAYIAGIDTVALGPQGLAYKAPIAGTTFNLGGNTYGESLVGNLVTDSYRAVVATLQPSAPPVIAVEADGLIRAGILNGAHSTGAIWLADLFRVLPLGIGPDQRPGYPLVTFYLNARDIASTLELGAAPELIKDYFFLQVSGLKVQYDMSKGPLSRVSSLKLTTAGGDQTLDRTNTTVCYKVVAPTFVAGLTGLISTVTGGLLSAVPKDRDCVTPIDPTTNLVDADPITNGVQELKPWQALLRYVTSFPDTDADGIPNIPPVPYATIQGRITTK